MKTLEQMKEWYISAVRSVLIINFGIMDDEADRAVSAYRLREKLDADPHGQLENNVEGVAEDIARREFIGRPSDLTYKGYVTSIRYDSYLKHLYGKIEGISEFISFEAEPGQDIEEEFHRAVDDYLAYCEEYGKVPETGMEDAFAGNEEEDAEWRRRHQIRSAPKQKRSEVRPSGISTHQTQEDDPVSIPAEDLSDADFLRAFGIDPEEEILQADEMGRDPRLFADEDLLKEEGLISEDAFKDTCAAGRRAAYNESSLEYDLKTGLTREQIASMDDAAFLNFMGVDPDDVIF